jgi:hypothetical protein
MAVEFDAKHIEDFAFQPIGRQMHADCASRMKAIRDPRFHAGSLVAGEAANEINEVESVWFLGPINGG